VEQLSSLPTPPAQSVALGKRRFGNRCGASFFVAYAGPHNLRKNGAGVQRNRPKKRLQIGMDSSLSQRNLLQLETGNDRKGATLQPLPLVM